MATERSQVTAAITAWKHGEAGLTDTVNTVSDILGMDEVETIEDLLDAFGEQSIDTIVNEIDSSLSLDYELEPSEDEIDVDDVPDNGQVKS